MASTKLPLCQGVVVRELHLRGQQVLPALQDFQKRIPTRRIHVTASLASQHRRTLHRRVEVASRQARVTCADQIEFFEALTQHALPRLSLL